MENGKILVVLTTYSRGKNLPDIVESIKKQTYKNWRIFISIDPGSFDAEPIAKEIVENNPDIDIGYAKNSINLGELGNLKAAMIKNDGIADFVVPLQDDCIYLDFNYFENAVSVLEQKSDVYVVMGRPVANGIPGKAWQNHTLVSGVDLWRRWPVSMLWAGGIFRFKTFLEIVMKDPPRNGHCGDSIIILRNAFKGFIFLYNSNVIEMAYNKGSSPYSYLSEDPVRFIKWREAYYNELTSDAKKYGVSDKEISEWLLRCRYQIVMEALMAVKHGNFESGKVDEWIATLSNYDRNLTDLIIKNLINSIRFE